MRETLRYMDISDGVAIHHDGDLPARAGLGSSSSFTVGLLHSLCALKGIMPSKRQLAADAIKIEQDVLKENVGSQDQVSAAFGGFNRIAFDSDDSFHIRPVVLPAERLILLQRSLMLFFTGISRHASEVAGEQTKATPRKTSELRTMYQLVDEAIDVLGSNTDLSEFGHLLHENWQIKRSLTERISNSRIDEIYETARKAGAAGGKLLGAGAGGFMLFFSSPEVQPRIKEALGQLLHVPFDFESTGSQIIYYEPTAGAPGRPHPPDGVRGS